MSTTKIRSWQPMAELDLFKNAFDRVFNDAFPNGETRLGHFRPAADAYETDDEVVIRLDLPGVSPDDIEITFEKDSLTVRGEMNSARDESENNWALRERVRGEFMRRFTLRTLVEADKASASFDQGVLTLSLPKSEATKPRKIEIKAG